MIDREKVVRGLECCTRRPLEFACYECPYHDPDGTGCNCDQLEKDALELLTGQEPEQPEKIETGKMKICSLESKTMYKGRFENRTGLIYDEPWVTIYWNDLITQERNEITMSYQDWIRFSKEIVDAVARFEMEG